MKWWVGFFCLFSLYFLYGFYLSQFEISPLLSNLGRESRLGFYDYKGAINVRTSLSQGSSSPLDVIAEAKKTDLDFLIFTDSNLLGRDSDHGLANGYFGNLLVMNEREYSYLDSRLLYIAGHHPGPSDRIRHLSDMQLFLTDMLSQSKNMTEGIAILAHPINLRPTWVGNYPPGLDGFEVLNPKRLSQMVWANNKVSVLWSLLFYPFNPRYAFLRLFTEPSEEVRIWEDLITQSKTWGFAGSDASARAIPFAHYLVNFPSYKKSFEIVSNHILLQSELVGNFIKDRQKIYRALKEGCFYFSFDLLGNPKGFFAGIREGNHFHQIGSEVHLSGVDLSSRTSPFHLEVHLPVVPKDFYEIVVWRNGIRFFTSNESHLKMPILEEGIYRVTVRVSPYLAIPDGYHWITWIYTNPFFVR